MLISLQSMSTAKCIAVIKKSNRFYLPVTCRQVIELSSRWTMYHTLGNTSDTVLTTSML